MSWQDNYKVINIKPGRVVSGKRIVDLSDPNVPEAIIEEMVKSGSRYLVKKKKTSTLASPKK